jgi:hypothetical protein
LPQILRKKHFNIKSLNFLSSEVEALKIKKLIGGVTGKY